MSVWCPQCQQNVPEGKFCQRCGTPFDTLATASTPVETSATPSAAATPTVARNDVLAEPPSAAHANCPHCGAIVPTGAFCQRCGGSLSAATQEMFRPSEVPPDAAETATLPPVPPAGAPPHMAPAYGAAPAPLVTEGPVQPPRSVNATLWWSVLAGFVVAALVMALVVWWLNRGDDEDVAATSTIPSDTPSVSDDTPTPQTPSRSWTTYSQQPTPSPSPVVTPSGALSSGMTTECGFTAAPKPNGMECSSYAASLLVAQRQQDISRLRLDKHWLVVLSSKYDGIYDPLQTAPDGGHVFDNAAILNEHQQLRQRFGSAVMLINATDMGKRPSRSEVMWRTLYDPGFSSEDQAKAWCKQVFTGMSGKERENSCYPVPASPPHDGDDD